MPQAARSSGTSQSSLLQVLETLPTAAYTCDRDGLITYCNRNVIEIWGRTPKLNDPSERYCGALRLFTADGRPLQRDQCWMARTVLERVPHNGEEILIQQPDGSLRHALVHANPMFDEQGRFIGASNVLIDITDRKRFEDELAFQASHDALTSLPNRSMLLEALHRAISGAEIGNFPFALLLLDLDRFKSINDTFGHQYGDEILGQMRPRLLSVVGESDLVARLGGDEFGILLPGADRLQAVEMAEAILEVVSRPFPIGERSFDVGTSIGIAVRPEHGRDPATILRHADVAMYAAKWAQSGLAVYADHQQATTPHQISMAAELRRSIEQGAMALHYQPSVELATLDVVGVEALVRWPHPTRGLIPPGDFLALAEANGLMRKLDLWVFREALARRRQWLEAGLNLDVAINLSADSLLDGEFVDTIVEMFDDQIQFPSGLTVELTERVLMRDADRTRVALDRLRYLGIRVALDDFGTGYSSLAHLKRLEVDEIKLDVSFVREVPRSRLDACIAESIIDLGANLGLIVTAEGVERPETLEWLTSRGCDRAQGYYFAPALPPDELPRWVAARVAAEAV